MNCHRQKNAAYLPFVYSGTLVVQGQGIACVKAVGSHTELGKIGKALQIIETEPTPLQKETGRIVRNLALFGMLLCALVVIVYGLTRESWLNGILSGITWRWQYCRKNFQWS